MSASKVSALMSLTISAPAAIACPATVAFVVSIEMGMENSLRMAVIAGMTRFSSSASLTGSENGLVD